MEAAYEVHNRIASNVAQRLFREIPDMTNRLIALESVVVGIIATLPLTADGRDIALNCLIDGVRDSLAAQQLAHLISTGDHA